ncbi:hypothetical protein K435DRAFT_739434 [Dendrothele bispora CBS 962.96]|uniref:DUF4218 domain-containing protein n=1 Tax=Dendrothele bispora (strain CBS 962.96) TaxID=1314807 RepID=A0A4S8KL64_DENBC|nr:hypothetical protein K435DRAFT_739434 [Dendrothele bispora CBS 962.96]
MRFPHSFPYDFMHLIWENLIKNLIKLWTGQFKGMDCGTGDYQFEKEVWQAIGDATAASGSTIPSAYGVRVPNVAGDGVYLTADMLSFWAMYLGPILMRSRFKHVRYYNHFIRLVKLLNVCLQFEMTSEEIEDVRLGFISWVKDYERFYYQYDAERLPMCPLTIHALLHIAPSIKVSGPVWCYWAFPMERYCGKLLPAIRSRRFPFASLARHVVEDARLTQISTIYGVSRELALLPPRVGPISGTFIDPVAYPTCRLHPPRNVKRPEENTLVLLVGALVTRFNDNERGIKVTPSTVRRCLREADIEEWAKLQTIDSDRGDMMRASELGATRDDSRDASFVRYQMYVDLNALRRNARPKYELQTFYGQLLRIYLIRFQQPCPQLGLSEPSTIIMASIKTCNLLQEQIPGLDIHFYSTMGKTDVIDATSLQCLVGRINCGHNKWAIIDRSGSLARAQAESGIDIVDNEPDV